MPKWWVGHSTMTKDAPSVLVLARYRSPGEAARVADALCRQTYAHTRLVFLVPDGDESSVPAGPAPHEICPRNSLADLLHQSNAAYLFYWPDEDDLHETALEKLVLALHLAPDQDGVTDSSHGIDGLLLTRLRGDAPDYATRWLDSKMKWLTEVTRRKLSFFFIGEALTREPADSTEDFGAAERFFVRLPYIFSHCQYEPVPEEPLWPVSVATPDPRHVLFLVPNLPLGGSSKFLLDVIGQLKASGHRITVAITTDETNPSLDELLRLIPDVFVLSHARTAEIPRLIVHLACTRGCGRVVISDSLLGYQLLAWLRGQLPGVSFIDYVHIEYPDGGYALRSVNYQSLLDLTLVSSEHLRHWIIAQGADGDKIQVCHTNIDTEKWKPDAATRANERAALGLADQTTMILYASRIAPQKRPELLCNIVAALRRATDRPFVVIVAGSGPLLPAMEKFVDDQKLSDHLTILGDVPLERIARLHDASDIFLLPSQSEGIATALYEAMALESVPVVSNVGGHRELVTAECGHLIPLGEPGEEMAAYVAVLKHLIENPALRRKKAEACRARIRDHFRLSQMTTRFIGALEKADARRLRQPVSLPDATIGRDGAALAMDNMRLKKQGRQAYDYGADMAELAAKRDKVIAKLQDQVAHLRAQLKEEQNRRNDVPHYAALS
jgi:glycosyltransferase involved in cell wall biosynthesis